MPAPENLNVQQPGQQPAASADQATPVVHRFIVKHKGGGRYAVFDTDNNGEQAGDFLGTEEEAIAEAKRLIDGGAPFIKPDETEPAQQQPAASADQATPDPRELSRPVLTSEGWLCPAPREA